MTTPTPPPGCPAHRLYGPEAEADPTGLYEKLRAEHGAVAPVLVQGDLPAWLVLGHRENLDVARTPSRFSRDSRRWRDMQDGNVPADHPLTPVAAWQPVCNFADGMEHERLRGAVTESLERFDRRGIRRYVKRFADQLIDCFAERGRADLVTDFAEPLPMLVMTQLVGMPDSYGPRLVEAARDMIKGTETAVASNEYVTVALKALVERKRAVPGRDFASWLLEHSTSLTGDEIIEHLRLVLIAAFATTANLIANTLRMVLTDRRFRASLSGGHMTLPDALEQVLWDEPPLATVLGRWATGDTELGGRQIKAGDMLLLGLAAGNVDPEIRPDLSQPVHGNRSHLAFSGGPHECPGQDIGRAIADTGIDALLARLPDLQLGVLVAELSWESSLMSRQLIALPVSFTPGGSSVTASSAVPGTPKAEPLPQAVVPPAPAPAPAPRDSGRTARSWWARLLRR
ncbi:cytochrome P450 [Streptomyces sp. NPDC005408]|uniref:cytochrome P450 n=1 Tax=Streptomyces sp. NPDC005408 TaxID=3155341 RepID=UPI0033AB7A8F